MSKLISDTTYYAIATLIVTLTCVVFLAGAILAFYFFITINAPAEFSQPFTLSFFFPIALRRRIIEGEGPSSSWNSKRILIVGLLEIGYRHFVWHHPYPLESRVWVYVEQLGRRAPAFIIHYHRTSQRYLVDFGRSLGLIFSSSIVGYMSNAEWSRFWMHGNRGLGVGNGVSRLDGAV